MSATRASEGCSVDGLHSVQVKYRCQLECRGVDLAGLRDRTPNYIQVCAREDRARLQDL